MRNIEYLEHFFRKHGLKGQVKVRYSGAEENDDDMSSVVIDGNEMMMNDIRFDIDSQLDPDVGDQWMEINGKSRTPFIDWMRGGDLYVPGNIDKSSIERYQKEMEEIVGNIKDSIEAVFKLRGEDDEDD